MYVCVCARSHVYIYFENYVVLKRIYTYSTCYEIDSCSFNGNSLVKQ